jgi:undecaprenyl-diphosphatase
LPVTGVDEGLKRLTHSADHSVLWFAVAAALAARKGVTRRGALRGVVSITLASLTANTVLKPLIPRRCPPADLLPMPRRLPTRPTSSSFPSGHAASAAAFATAVALESPRTGLLVAPLAATVAYSRVHVGAHWASDVVVGAAFGAGVATATRRWWPVRDSDEADAHTAREVPRLVEGKGLVVLVNPASGDPDHDPTDEIVEALPAATVLRAEPGLDLIEQLEAELATRTDPAEAVGAAGGDGTVAAAAVVAVRHALPLVVVPTGTLNHFARDIGVYDLREVVDATGAGEAVSVDVASVEMDPGTDRARAHHMLNTASLGSYPELVRRRDKWQGRWGKWPAFAAALVVTLSRAEPIRFRIDRKWRSVWFMFVGNGPYHPRGAVPAYRTRLDSGLLDVRWVRADVPLSRLRAVTALLLAAVGHSRVYGERLVRELDVELDRPRSLATDGEVVGDATTVRFSVAPPLAVYRRDEDNPRWADRDRPYHPQ